MASVGLGLVVGAALLEAGARVLGLAPNVEPIVLDRPYASFVTSPNPRLRYVPKPGATGINAYGLRDHDYTLAKPPGTLRVVVLGDSIAFGYCNATESIALDDTFPKILERRLNDPPPTGLRAVEVVNLAVSGYETLQEIEFLREKGLALDPDLVLVAYCLNDAEESSMELVGFREHEGFGLWRIAGPETLQAAFLRSHLVRAVWYRTAMLANSSSSSPAAEDGRRERGFDELRALASDEGFDTLIAIFPNLFRLSPYDYREEHEETRRIAESRDFPVIDLLPALNRAAGGVAARVRGRCTSVHPNEYGHAVAAEALEPLVRAAATERARGGLHR